MKVKAGNVLSRENLDLHLISCGSWVAKQQQSCIILWGLEATISLI